MDEALVFHQRGVGREYEIQPGQNLAYSWDAQLNDKKIDLRLAAETRTCELNLTEINEVRVPTDIQEMQAKLGDRKIYPWIYIDGPVK